MLAGRGRSKLAPPCRDISIMAEFSLHFVFRLFLMMFISVQNVFFKPNKIKVLVSVASSQHPTFSASARISSHNISSLHRQS